MLMHRGLLALADSTPGAARLVGGLLLWIVVCVVLAVPLVILARSIARRRATARPPAEMRASTVDAWSESARRMEASE